MSEYERHHGHRGGRRRHYQRDDYEDRRREEAPDQKTKNLVIRLGEVDAAEEVARVAAQLVQPPHAVPAIAEAFRISVTEQPFKIPYHAALLHHLHNETTEGEAPIGPTVLEDIWRGFQSCLDKLAWREIRYYIQFFAHLTEAKIISSDSMVALLLSLIAVLDEFGASYGRAKRAALAAAEGLMIAGYTLKQAVPDKVASMIESIQSYNEGVVASKWVVQPEAHFSLEKQSTTYSSELLDCAVSALKALDAEDFTSHSTLRPYANYPLPSASSFTAFDLPSVLVPPEVIEVEGLSATTGEELHIKKEEWPEHFLKLFDASITPVPQSPAGYAVKSGIMDIITIFEVNRKECARLLLEYPKWTVPGTFKPKPGSQSSSEPIEGNNWELESTVIETVIGAYLRLPETANAVIYYTSLITELCKLSPGTVGPAVGKTIRKLYSLLADGLDIELARRFAEWFAIHMSNFGFSWVWKEWVPDLSLGKDHPRRMFMRHAVELEIRLSYHDRIMKTLPESMQNPDAEVAPVEAPGPNFEYDEPGKPHYEAAQSILNLLRGRSKAEDVIAQLDSIKNTMETSEDEPVANIDSVIRSIVVQSLLHVGSRSFSHLLNALERYLTLLRNIANSSESGTNKEPKADILSAAATFWKYNQQMVVIVFDKLMQYQIVDPADVISWAFERGTEHESGLRSSTWDLLKGAIDKANGRVIIATRKLSALRKEDDEQRAKANADAGGVMEVDGDIKQEAETNPTENVPLSNAIKAVDSLVREQKSALSSTLEGFVNCLTSTCPAAARVLDDEQWSNRDSWDSSEWIAWETWSWYRHFCRFYAPYLRNYQATLSTVSFTKLEGSTDPRVELVRRIWNISTGQES